MIRQKVHSELIKRRI